MTSAIGIDLGTTYSCVGLYLDGQVQIFPNEQGKRTTPSCVSFTDTGILVGEEAKINIDSNPKSTIYDSKILIGRRFTDETVQNDMRQLPYKIVNENRMKIKVRHKGVWKTVHPEEISAHILRKMKSIVEQKIDAPVKDVVISVPGYFSDAQRQATKDAGVIAGLNVLKVINEPMAAAIAFGLNNIRGKKNVLIYDLGGGTFDATIFEINEGVFKVKSTAGNTHLGGQDFTNNMVTYCMNEIRKKSKSSVKFDSSSIAKLRIYCDDAKRTLSSANKTNFIFNLSNTCHTISITRDCFENLNDNLFRFTLDAIEVALDDANMSKNEIDEVVMVGGSTRIPRIQSLLQTFFNGKKLNFTLNPEECVAYGAAIHAAILSKSKTLQNMHFMDVNPYSLGINAPGGVMKVLIPRNTTIPHELTMSYPTSQANQVEISINVYEGERPISKENNKLDTYIFSGLPPEPMGSVKIDITFKLNVDGLLQVSATEKSSGDTKTIEVKNNTDRLSQADIVRLINESEKFKKDEDERLRVLAMRNKLEEFCYQIKSDLKYREYSFTEYSKIRILNKCDEILKWLDDNSDSDYSEYSCRFQELKNDFEEYS